MLNVSKTANLIMNDKVPFRAAAATAAATEAAETEAATEEAAGLVKRKI